jgi:hypothetical protein
MMTGDISPLTKLQTFFPRVCFPRQSIHPKDDMYLVQSTLNPSNDCPNNLTFAVPLQLLKVLMPLGRKLVHTAHDQRECTVKRLFLGKLLALGFDRRTPLPQLPHAWLECLLFQQTLCIAINEARQALVQLASLVLSCYPLLVLPLPVGVEAACKLLGQSLRMR